MNHLLERMDRQQQSPDGKDGNRKREVGRPFLSTTSTLSVGDGRRACGTQASKRCLRATCC